MLPQTDTIDVKEDDLMIVVDIIFIFFGALYLTFRLGQEDGKWGCFTVLVLFMLAAIIYTMFD